MKQPSILLTGVSIPGASLDRSIAVRVDAIMLVQRGHVQMEQKKQDSPSSKIAQFNPAAGVGKECTIVHLFNGQALFVEEPVKQVKKLIEGATRWWK